MKLEKIKIESLILQFLFIVFSVGMINFFIIKRNLLLITITLLIIVLIRNKKIDQIVYIVIIYGSFVHILSMLMFQESESKILSLGLIITRFLLAYLILKISGKIFLINFERFSFILILFSLILFFLDNNFHQVGAFFSKFDFNSIPIQREYGGWNILFYVHNGWAGFRFSGYAWEPGAMAMMITFSWVIYIINNGSLLNKRVVLYFIAMIFTFSTTGYFVLGLLTLFYAFNIRGKFSFITGGIIILSLILIIPTIAKSDFMSKKIGIYYKRLEREQKKYETYRDINYRNVGRVSSAFVGAENIIFWPIGHGITTNGRVKNIYGELVSGANGIVTFLINWGLLGGVFLFYSIYLFIFKQNMTNELKFRSFLFFSLILVFASNPVSYRPVLFVTILYPYMFLKKRKYKNEK